MFQKTTKPLRVLGCSIPKSSHPSADQLPQRRRTRLPNKLLDGGGGSRSSPTSWPRNPQTAPPLQKPPNTQQVDFGISEDPQTIPLGFCPQGFGLSFHHVTLQDSEMNRPLLPWCLGQICTVHPPYHPLPRSFNRRKLPESSLRFGFTKKCFILKNKVFMLFFL